MYLQTDAESCAVSVRANTIRASHAQNKGYNTASTVYQFGLKLQVEMAIDVGNLEPPTIFNCYSNNSSLYWLCRNAAIPCLTFL